MTPKVPKHYTYPYVFLDLGKWRVGTVSVWPRSKPARLSLRKPLNALPRPTRRPKFMRKIELGVSDAILGKPRPYRWLTERPYGFGPYTPL